MSTCIVIPCYNEEDRLPLASFGDFLQQNDDFTLLFVDDGSTDQTIKVLELLKDKFPAQITVYALAKNAGKAEAVRQGMIQAARESKFKYVGFTDADLSAPLHVMSELRNVLEEQPATTKAAIGSRVKRLGAAIDRRWTRHISGRVFATLASGILKISVYDSQCGAKLFRSASVPDLFNDSFSSAWFFDLEIILRAGEKNLIEVPISAWREIEGSKIRFSDFIRAPFELLKIRRRYKSG